MPDLPLSPPPASVGLAFASLKGFIKEKHLDEALAIPVMRLASSSLWNAAQRSFWKSIVSQTQAKTLADILDKTQVDLQRHLFAQSDSRMLQEMERVLRELLPRIGSGAQAVPAPRGVALPSSEARALIERIEKAGAADLIEETHPSDRYGYRQTPYRLPQGISVRDLLLDTGAGRMGTLMSPRHLAHYQRITIDELEESLRQRLRDDREVQQYDEAVERDLATPVTDPTLRLVDQRLRALRDHLRASTTHRTPPRARQTSVKVIDPPPTFQVIALYQVDPHRPAREERCEVRIELRDWPGTDLRTTCTCRKPACVHQRFALDVTLRSLREGTDLPQLVEVLTTPSWSKALRALEKGLLQVESVGAEEVLLRWRIDEGDDLPEVEPYLHKRLKSGAWSAGTRISPRSALQDLGERLDPTDRRVLGLMDSAFGRGGDPLGVIELLVGHPRVFLRQAPTRRVTVRAAHVSVRVETGERGLVLQACLDGRPGSAAAVQRAVQEQDSRMAWLDEAAAECLLAPLPRALSPLVSMLDVFGDAFPEEARASLLARLGALESVLPLTLPAELEGEAVPPATGLTLRLAPEGDVVEAGVWVRPLAGGPEFHPGEGPARVSAFGAGGVRKHTVRDLAREVTNAHERLRPVPLTLDGPEPWSVALAGDAALDLVHALGALPPEVVVEWPKDRRLATRSSAKASLRVRVRDYRDWFGLEGELELDEGRLTLAALLEAVRLGRRYVPLGRDRFLSLETELRDRLAKAAELAYVSKSGLEVAPSAAEAIDAIASGATEVQYDPGWQAVSARLKKARALEPKVPAGLKAELRPYQVEGFRWAMRLAEWGVGACLADDMGLGKTLEALAVLVARSRKGPALVVAPTSVCFNWVSEAARFAPGLRLRRYLGEKSQALEGLRAGDVVVASYTRVQRDVELLKGVEWATLVLDEAQAIKNAAAQRTRAVRDIKADWKLALTGTPIENHLGELWSLFRVLSPGLLGSWEQFRERFATPIEAGHDPVRRAGLARAVQPFVLRRTKAAVAPELPARTEILRPVMLSAAERELYDRVRMASLAQLQGVALEEQAGKGRFAVLAALTRLRQVACHPRLYDPESTLASAKLAALMELVDELRDEGHRALVFSQFTSHLALVREALDAQKVPYLYLDGETPEVERAQRVQAFQKGQGALFLISLKAGGVGLNLTGADYVIHLDPWWNPAVEDQATDRAHRIGQTKPVTVYRLVSQGTIEESILALHAEKRDLVAGLLEGTDAAGKLSTTQLLDLIRTGEASTEEAAAERESESGSESESEPERTPEEPGSSPASEASPAEPEAGASLGSWGEEFERWLGEEVTAGALGRPAAKQYVRSLGRFITHVGKARTLTQDQLGEQVEGYLEALRNKTIKAPGSELGIARTALGRFQRWLKANHTEALSR